MVRNISQIVYQLFQKETLDEVSESELRYFIRQYPYAGTGHLLLAKKLQMEGEKRAFEREIAVTSIYFNNPAWLQFVLQEPNGNGTADTQHPPLPIHPSEIEKQIDPEDELEQENTEVDDQEVQPADEPVVVTPEEVNNPAVEKYNTASEAPHQNSEYNANEQPEVSADDIPGDIEDEVNEEKNDQTDTDARLNTEQQEGLNTEQQEEKEPRLESEEEEEPQDEVDDSTHHSKSDEPLIGVQSLASAEAAPVSPKELFYDDGEVFAEFIAEETNEELRLNEETLNAPWETEEEDEAQNSSGEEEPASDEELRMNFEKRKHLTSEVVAGDVERPELFVRDSEQANNEQPGHQVEYSDDQMVERPDLISFEAQKASQRDPLPEEYENNGQPETVADLSQKRIKSPVLAEDTASVKDPGPMSVEGVDSFVAKNLEAALTKDASVDLQKLEFDPYHTIDYFASQGIKLRLEDFSKDKLGQQLKSFTEWIRSMKRLPQQVAENNMDESAQHSIRRIAEHSVEEKEVLTESMAEVWVKQGNYEKARQIYRKLSLQNPSKSTYFAAKIDQLKVL